MSRNVTLSELAFILKQHGYRIMMAYQYKGFHMHGVRGYIFVLDGKELNEYISMKKPNLFYRTSKAKSKGVNKVIRDFIKTPIQKRYYNNYYSVNPKCSISQLINHVFKKANHKYVTLSQFVHTLHSQFCSVALRPSHTHSHDFVFDVQSHHGYHSEIDLTIDAEHSFRKEYHMTSCNYDRVMQIIGDFLRTPIKKRKYDDYYGSDVFYMDVHNSFSNIIDKRLTEISKDSLNHDLKNRVDFNKMLKHPTAHQPKQINGYHAQTVNLQLTPTEVRYLNWLHQVGDADGNKIYGGLTDTLHELLHQSIMCDSEGNFKLNPDDKND